MLMNWSPPIVTVARESEMTTVFLVPMIMFIMVMMIVVLILLVILFFRFLRIFTARQDIRRFCCRFRRRRFSFLLFRFLRIFTARQDIRGFCRRFRWVCRSWLIWLSIIFTPRQYIRRLWGRISRRVFTSHNPPKCVGSRIVAEISDIRRISPSKSSIGIDDCLVHNNIRQPLPFRICLWSYRVLILGEIIIKHFISNWREGPNMDEMHIINIRSKPGAVISLSTP